MSPAVAVHAGMCRSKSERGGQKDRDIQEDRQGEKDRKCVFLVVKSQLRCGQGHPLTYDIHGARLSLSLGRSPSARTDKTGYFMCSRQTPLLCIVWL